MLDVIKLIFTIALTAVMIYVAVSLMVMEYMETPGELGGYGLVSIGIMFVLLLIVLAIKETVD